MRCNCLINWIPVIGEKVHQYQLLYSGSVISVEGQRVRVYAEFDDNSEVFDEGICTIVPLTGHMDWCDKLNGIAPAREPKTL